MEWKRWKRFRDAIPEEDSRILVCGFIDTDPLYQSSKPIYMEIVTYDDGMITADGDEHWTREPDPETYWMYLKNIPTPFDDENTIKSCVCPKCLKKDK